MKPALRTFAFGERLERLFAVALCRDLWPLLTDERSRVAVEVAERFADGRATVKERRIAYKAASEAYFEVSAVLSQGMSPDAVDRSLAALAARAAADTHPKASRAYHSTINSGYPGVHGHPASSDSEVRRVLERQGQLLAAIAGPGWIFDPSWRTSSVVGLARACDGSADLSVMPVLADALEEAGCEDRGILDYCRGDGPYCRGCWVIDQALGRR